MKINIFLNRFSFIIICLLFPFIANNIQGSNSNNSGDEPVRPQHVQIHHTEWTKTGEIYQSKLKGSHHPTNFNLQGHRESMEYEVTFNKPEIQNINGFDHVRIQREKKGFSQSFKKTMMEIGAWTSESGSPRVPIQTQKILIPYGQHVVNISIDPGPRQEVQGSFYIEPAQPPTPILSGVLPVHQNPNAAIYESNQIYISR